MIDKYNNDFDLTERSTLNIFNTLQIKIDHNRHNTKLITNYE